MRDHGKSRFGEVVSSFALSYIVGALLLVALIYHADVWNVLANTRLLDPLIEGGVIRYHDGHIGLVDGVNDQDTYLASQDPIDYRLLAIAALIYFLYWGVKAVKFHGVARFLGLKGTAGQHSRAWLYGDGLGLFFPMRFGEAATAAAMEGHDEDPTKVQQAFGITEFLTLVFQIGAFWLFGLFVTSYPIWFAQSMWALIICGVAYLVVRKTSLVGFGAQGYWRSMGSAFRALAERPATFAKLAFLAVFLMLLDDLTPFIIAMAFTGDHVILNVSFFVIQSGVVAGYIARRFAITPRGIGQWEWGFAMALYVSGVGFPEAATIALLDSFVRHATGFIVFLIVTLRYSVPTTFHKVLERYMGPRIVPVEVDGVVGDAVAEGSGA